MRLMTYEDALRRLQRFVGGTALSRADEDLKQAVKNAYETITTYRKWNYYNGIFGFNTNAPVDSTATYIHATRKLTLATATPSWVLSGAVRLGGIVGDIESLNTASNPATIVMGSERNFGTDYASSQSVSLFQEHILLPDSFRQIQAVIGDPSGARLQEVSVSQYLHLMQNGGVTGEPEFYCIAQDPENLGRLSMYLYPAPSAVRTYRVHVVKKPRELWFSGGEGAAVNGTVAVTSGTRTCVGTNTELDSRMVGSVIRFTSSTKNLPTDEIGPNPYVEQRVISARADSTNWTVDSAMDNTYASTRFLISDPIDIDPICQPAFHARCRLELALLRSDTHLGKLISGLNANYIEAIDQAAATDQKNGEARATGRGVPGRTWTNLPYSGASWE